MVSETLLLRRINASTAVSGRKGRGKVFKLCSRNLARNIFGFIAAAQEKSDTRRWAFLGVARPLLLSALITDLIGRASGILIRALEPLFSYQSPSLFLPMTL